jgi:hypothetical protein
MDAGTRITRHPQEMMTGYLRYFELHLSEIKELAAAG